MTGPAVPFLCHGTNKSRQDMQWVQWGQKCCDSQTSLWNRWTGGPSELRFGSLGLWTGHIVRQRSQNGPDFVICPYISLKRIQVSTQSILHWSNHPRFWWFTRPLLQVSSDHCPTMPHWKRLVGSDANGARVAWSNDLGSVTLSWPLKIGQSLVKRGKSMVNQW